ncbi:hypothetical protein KR222_006652, partial [Zaprionus bogoriensis]
CSRLEFQYLESIQNEDGSVSLRPRTNYFPLTAINTYAFTHDLCMDRQGLPFVRRCVANEQWELLGDIQCQPTSALTRRLFNIDSLLTNRSILSVDAPRNSYDRHSYLMGYISQSVQQAEQPIVPIDVIFIARIVKALTQMQLLSLSAYLDMLTMCEHLMAIDPAVLELSDRLGAVDQLLQSFEESTNTLAPQLDPLKNCDWQHSAIDYPAKLLDVKVDMGLLLLIGHNLSVFYLHPECSNYTGIAIFNRDGPQRRNCKHHRYWYRLLQRDQSLAELKAEPGLVAATFLTDALWSALRQRGATNLVFKIYANNAFFIESSASAEKPAAMSNVLSVNVLPLPGELNGAYRSLPHTLTFLLRSAKQGDPEARHDFCGYWHQGSWQRSGVTTSMELSQTGESIVICRSSHLTQFAFLVGGSCMDERLLNIITTVGCGLSLLGVAGIWLTALLCKRWRATHSTRLLLNLTLAMALLYGLVLLLQLSESFWHVRFERGEIGCIVVGGIFQYAVLLLFAWMLIICHLQYQRHITLFVVRSEHAITKRALAAWTMPLLPTLLLVGLEPGAYRPPEYLLTKSVCYPSGNGLDYGILLPIGLVILVNSFAFGRIFYRIFSLTSRHAREAWLQLGLFVLLFFLLGLSWIFGIATYFQLGYAVNVIFCTTATIQGLVLFVYFVLFNKIARNFWLQLI